MPTGPYCIDNKQLTKQQYEQALKNYDFGSTEETKKYWEKFSDLRKNSIVKFANMINCENCTGDDHKNSKNLRECFDQTRCENIKYANRSVKAIDCQDFMGGDSQWCYNCSACGYGQNYIGCNIIEHSSDMYYSLNCYHSKNCFGCCGLKHKQYCILNKQYTKEEYKQKVAEIIESMTERGEWGDFFPPEMSPFGYNETLANSFFPKAKEEATSLGFKWHDLDYGLKYDGPFYEPADNINDYLNEAKQKELLGGVLKCERSGKPYKIMPQELAFYLEKKIPIPREHFNVRFEQMFSSRNPRKLYHRQCMCEQTGHDHSGPSSAEATDGKRCSNEFETTYAPDRPEKVYCEKCYQKTVI